MSGGFIRSAALKPAPVLRFERSGSGVRVAVVRCPYCTGEHRHVCPEDVRPEAPGRRMPPCHKRRPDYAITNPKEK